jgi:prephenate dehydrogenase
MPPDGDLLVVGTGLIGTSIGLAATAAGRRVWLTDADADRARFAASLGAGTAVAAPPGGVGLVVVAVPPRAVGAACIAALRDHPAAIVSHVCSVQSQPEREVESSGTDMTRFVGSHPIAGREVSGPSAAEGELFVDRPWVVCRSALTSDHAVEAVVGLASTCRARPVLLDARTHDQLLARLSHAPQLVASALAATLTAMEPPAAALAGPGLRDTTRLADSDPALWGQIAGANAPAVAAAVRTVAEALLEVAAVLETADPEGADAAVADLVRRGRSGRSLLPGKHGRAPVPLATVHCVVPDSPGALARLLTDIAADGVNVEDLRVEHAPGQAVGTAEIAVAPGDRSTLLAGLRGRGWTATEGAGEAL